MTYLLFAVALGLSTLAAYYAVMGLIAIFAAAVVPIALMGSLLEASKLVVASWLYRSWNEIPRLMKTYFTIALVVLMLLTSMGIFGFLSKAHLDQAVPSGDVAAKLALIDEKIKTEKENINASRKELSQLDSQVDQTISRTTEASGAERAIAIRRGQQKDRARILNEIGAAQTKIAKYNEERAPIASEVRKVEAEVGPIKYIAALIYGDDASEDVLEKSVRIVTIMIVLVFDPLAVLLLIAANWNLKHTEKKNELWRLPKLSEEVSNPDTTKTTETEKEIVLTDNVQVQEEPVIEQKAEEPPKEMVAQADSTDDEIPEIEVDEHNKEWEPSLYNRKEVKKDYDHHAPWVPANKTESFLNKVEKSVGVKSIEIEVDELQESKKS